MNNIFNPSPCLSKQQVEAYVKGELQENAIFSVENHLLDCPLCACAIEGYTAIDTPNHYHQLDQIDTLLQKQTKVTRIKRFTIRHIAAAAAILIALGFSSYFYAQNIKPDRLYADYHKVLETDAIFRGHSNASTFNSHINNAFTNYNTAHFKASLIHFERAIKQDPHNVTVLLYAGIAYNEAEQYPQAIDCLEKVRINSPIYFEESTWYLALIHLKQRKVTTARTLLQELAKIPDGYYTSKVRTLLNDL